MSDLPSWQTWSCFSDPIVRPFPDAVNRYRPRMALATKHEYGLFIDGETLDLYLETKGVLVSTSPKP